MAGTRKLPIYECFSTWQGEGVHMGRSAFFIRTFGCPVHCPWCDSAGTWHPEHIPEKIERITVEALVEAAQQSGAACVVITGGEPAIHDLTALTTGLREAGLRVHLETSGSFELKGTFDWITVSPKRWKASLEPVVRQAHECKLIIASEADLGYYTSLPGVTDCPHVWLHPEWSQRNNPMVINGITEWVKLKGDPYRAGYQLHKVYQADALDERSKASVNTRYG